MAGASGSRWPGDWAGKLRDEPYRKRPELRAGAAEAEVAAADKRVGRTAVAVDVARDDAADGLVAADAEAIGVEDEEDVQAQRAGLEADEGGVVD